MSNLLSYISERTRVINQERAQFLGGDLLLNEDEYKVDKLITKLKVEELELSYKDSTQFLPKQHFFKSKNEIVNSKIFKILKKLPKGHSLHTHSLAAVSIDFIITNITYMDNIYGKYIDDIFKMKFMKPENAKNEGWISLKEMREKDKDFDKWLKTQLSLVVVNPEESYPSIESVWTKFKKTFNCVYDMLSYKPAFEVYYSQCLKELYDDNIMYGEFRGTAMPLYDLQGTIYQDEDFFKLMLNVEQKFKETHNDFYGARFIYSIYRGVSFEDLRKDLKEILELQQKFPKLIVGLDFIGFEEEGHSLLHFYPELIGVEKDLHFFFHAGETNWFGHTDMNLVDAVLLKSKRIGHGFALSRHPVVMDLLSKEDIAIELCPISNQVLLLNDDPRNHSVITLLAKGFPVVVCSDDPAVWDASGLSFDWYVTFMAMTPKNCGLKFLKQLALNSIKYSALNEDETKAMDIWTKLWNKFISDMLLHIE
ncbi:hypothetical protein HHI36_005487 [Cryptolaemus montrouzieri]|uniref:Adenosine deaminase n=1 Tax=Cryptolaemus montrouzieri TaxID=559131 RepID=A0ABD2NUC7_9CUCU